jgi:hypothetical protein
MFVNKLDNPNYYDGFTTKKVIKKEWKPTLKCFIIFLGLLLLFNNTIVPTFSEIKVSIQNSIEKSKHEKVLDIKNLEIYIDIDENKYYSFYKMNGSTSIELVDENNLITADASELKERFGTFYKIDNYEIAFPTHKTQLLSEALFKINHNGTEYIIKSYIPQENTLELLAKSGFKEALSLNTDGTTVRKIYINNTSKEIAITENDFAITEKFIETPYNKEDYFSYRYDIFKSELLDNTFLPVDITVTTYNSFGSISSDITRVTFYSEGTEEKEYTGVMEIIFDKVAYVSRIPLMNFEEIDSIVRAQ